MNKNKDLAKSILRGSNLKSGLRLLTWNLVTECDSECCLYDRCKNQKDGSGCQVEKDYLNYILEPIFKYLENDLDEYDLVELGMRYIRLHHNLVRIQKEILANQIVYKTKSGPKVSPLLAEERALLQAIESLDINKLLRRRIKTKVKAITNGLALKSDDGKESLIPMVEILDDSDTIYTDKLAGED